MERINKSGRILIEYRQEYKKHYSDSIDVALKEAVNLMYNTKKIDEKIFRNIFNENISDEEFIKIVEKNKLFTKNNKELNYEFDMVRKKVNDYMISIDFVESMNTKNSIDMNKIIIVHQFDLNQDFIKSSFGINDSEMAQLMKRRGFIEKYAVLRLNQVFKEIYSEMRIPEDIDHGYSLVYYNKELKGFSIDYKYYIAVPLAANETKMKELVDSIKNLDGIISRKFINKLGANYFNTVKKEKNMIPIKNDKKPLPNKQVLIDSPTTIVENVKLDNNKTPVVKTDEKLPEKDKDVETTKSSNEQFVTTFDSIGSDKNSDKTNPGKKFGNKNDYHSKGEKTNPKQGNGKQNEKFPNTNKNTNKNQNTPEPKQITVPVIDEEVVVVEPNVQELEIEFDISDKDLL